MFCKRFRQPLSEQTPYHWEVLTEDFFPAGWRGPDFIEQNPNGFLLIMRLGFFRSRGTLRSFLPWDIAIGEPPPFNLTEIAAGPFPGAMIIARNSLLQLPEFQGYLRNHIPNTQILLANQDPEHISFIPFEVREYGNILAINNQTARSKYLRGLRDDQRKKLLHAFLNLAEARIPLQPSQILQADNQEAPQPPTAQHHLKHKRSKKKNRRSTTTTTTQQQIPAVEQEQQNQEAETLEITAQEQEKLEEQEATPSVPIPTPTLAPEESVQELPSLSDLPLSSPAPQLNTRNAPPEQRHWEFHQPRPQAGVRGRFRDDRHEVLRQQQQADPTGHGWHLQDRAAVLPPIQNGQPQQREPRTEQQTQGTVEQVETGFAGQNDLETQGTPCPNVTVEMPQPSAEIFWPLYELYHPELWPEPIIPELRQNTPEEIRRSSDSFIAACIQSGHRGLGFW